MLALVSLALLVAAFPSDSPEEIVTRSFDQSGFHAVDNAGPYDVTVRRGASFSIQAEGPRLTIERMAVSVEDGTLRLASIKETAKKDPKRNNLPTTRIAVTLPALDGATLSGAGKLDVDRIDGDAVTLALSGAGNLTVARLDSRHATMTLKGAGKIVATGGNADRVTAVLQGAGSVDADGVSARNAKLDLSGVGNVKLRASGEAEIDAGGMGNATVIGTTACRISKTGMGQASCKAG